MILLTGATGLVGSHLLWALLSRGHRIAALVRPGSDTANVRETFLFYTKDPDPLLSRIEWRTGDLLDPASLTAALEGITCVINCAAVVSFDPKDRGLLVRSNVQGAANLVEAMWRRDDKTVRPEDGKTVRLEDGKTVRLEDDKTVRLEDDKTVRLEDDKTVRLEDGKTVRSVGGICSSPPLLVHISSISALGDGPGNSTKFLINEETPRDPKRKHTAYSDSKYLSERVILESGIPAVVLNPGIILGPGQWNRGSSLLFRQAWEGMKYYPYGGVGYVDVRDVAEVVGRVMEGTDAGGHVGPLETGGQVGLLETGGYVGPLETGGYVGPLETGGHVGPPLRNVIGERYCVVGHNLRYREFFNLVTDEFGLPNPTVYASRTMTEIAWRAEAVKAFVTRTRPRITREIAASSQRISFFSSNKIRQALGFEFRPIEETIEWVADCFKKTEDMRQKT